MILWSIIAVPLAVAAVLLVLPSRWCGRAALAAPAAVLALGVPLWPAVRGGEVLRYPAAWFPSLAITADLRADRLGVFFVVLVGAVGVGVVQYARHYFADGGTRGFWATLLAFMAAMLGVALSDSLVLLFVFWELTTITSALLIGLHFQEPEARRGAVQAFVVTGAGGLALLAGVVLLGQLGGSYTLSGLEARADALVAHPGHTLPLVLLLAGAFTKSAQFPFHFWLPGAMQAPAPVSAYLHSATMVKAGLLLIGRLFPIFHESPLWLPLLGAVGLTTFVVAGWSAVRADDLKQLLAYSTVAYLGVMVAFYGYSARVGLKGELIGLANHALYKSSLFLLVGWLEKAAGTRDLLLLERERWVQREPLAAALFTIAAVAMAGLPLVLGFTSKESFYTAVAGGKVQALTPALAVAVLGSVLATVYALKLVAGTFWGWRPPSTDRGAPRDRISPWLLVVPAALLVPQAAGGVAPGWLLGAVLDPGNESGYGIAVWKAADLKLALGLATLAAGCAGYAVWRRLAAVPLPPGPRTLAEGAAKGTLAMAAWLGRAVQAGGHPRYLSVLLLAAAACVAGAAAAWPGGGDGLARGGWGPELHLAWLPAAAVAAGTVLAVAVGDRIAKLVMMAIVGYGMAVFYVLFRAPDLALTQLLVETVSLILFLLAFRFLPRLAGDARRGPRRAAHALVALATGSAMGWLAWAAGSYTAAEPAGAAHLRLAHPAAKGENVVNVILVDFRSMDTLGEIAVLAIAAFGVLALLRARPGGRGAPSAPDGEAP